MSDVRDIDPFDDKAAVQSPPASSLPAPLTTMGRNLILIVGVLGLEPQVILHLRFHEPARMGLL